MSGAVYKLQGNQLAVLLGQVDGFDDGHGAIRAWDLF